MRVAAHDFGYAEWLADGGGFYVVGDGAVQRYDAEGRRSGAKITLRGLPEDAVLAPPGFAHQGLSVDGKRLALVVTVPGGGAIVFQRLCDDPADSFVGLVRTR